MPNDVEIKKDMGVTFSGSKRLLLVGGVCGMLFSARLSPRTTHHHSPNSATSTKLTTHPTTIPTMAPGLNPPDPPDELSLEGVGASEPPDELPVE